MLEIETGLAKLSCQNITFISAVANVVKLMKNCFSEVTLMALAQQL